MTETQLQNFYPPTHFSYKIYIFYLAAAAEAHTQVSLSSISTRKIAKQLLSKKGMANAV